MVKRKPLSPNNRKPKQLIGEFKRTGAFSNSERNAGRELASVRTISGRGGIVDGSSGGGTRVGKKRG